MAKIKSGGGAQMNKNVKPPIRSGPPTTRKVDPGAVSKLGAHLGNHTAKGTTNLPKQPIIKGTAPQVPLGNQVALDIGKGAPGAGRTVSRSGSQGTHGPVVGPPAVEGRNVWNDFPGPGGKR